MSSPKRRQPPPMQLQLQPDVPSSPSSPSRTPVPYTPPRPGQKPLLLAEKHLQRPKTRRWVPATPWTPSTPSTSELTTPPLTLDSPYGHDYGHAQQPAYGQATYPLLPSPVICSPERTERRISEEDDLPPLSHLHTHAHSKAPSSPSSSCSSRSSSPPNTPSSGRSTPTSVSTKETSSPFELTPIPRSPSYLAFVQHQTPSRRPTGEYITPPSVSLLRPTTFWKNAYRTALGLPSDAPSSQLVRSSSFIVAGRQLDDLSTREDLGVLCVTPRREFDREVVLLPQGGY
ncbi:hypothetical protein DACRYDRAFT_111212 [Dacryopinax primogenitus]|uniref:Uncharacterized protein n=1 Tax=Dacryopinax primogenitus (strain DJM 731) TaxID=1858805 RepID=M5G3A9_DACPD|nr:uncharacterized protein DACRYDRAFT_111212 [Dacryopinax primogenitus]EJT98242.1 hypothetical protein DACRYDRAFT_111212 [Dacryopinax primogenitus]